MTNILILTEPGDYHAIAVAEALQRKGAIATLWATADFPTRSEESVLFDDAARGRLHIRGPQLELLDPAFDVVWRRRPAYVLDTGSLHPADRAFADGECSLFRRSLFRLLAPSARWVNPLDAAARAASKLLQHAAAAGIGLQLPKTLFSNSPREIRAFLAQPGETVYKPLSPVGWKDDTADFLPYTALVTEKSLVADPILRQTPGIYQKLVPKAYEIRATVMGERVFAAKLLSQDTAKGKLDWRASYDELRFEPIELPPAVMEQCRGLLEELGLVFGCFDFIVTPDGTHVFLEVNEMGQFLFVERYCGLPLLDAFAEFLLQGRVDFDWTAGAVTVRYGDPAFEAAANARAEEFQRSHVGAREALIDETSPAPSAGRRTRRPRASA